MLSPDLLAELTRIANAPMPEADDDQVAVSTVKAILGADMAPGGMRQLMITIMRFAKSELRRIDKMEAESGQPPKVEDHSSAATELDELRDAFLSNEDFATMPEEDQQLGFRSFMLGVRMLSRMMIMDRVLAMRTMLVALQHCDCANCRARKEDEKVIHAATAAEIAELERIMNQGEPNA